MVPPQAFSPLTRSNEVHRVVGCAFVAEAHHPQENAMTPERPRGSVTDNAANTRLWYFSYGTNMNPKTFESMHIRPTRCVAGTLDLYLNFQMLVIPYMEPCFPSVGPERTLPDQPHCHGVAFEVTDREFRHICLKEAGNGHKGLGYEVTDMRCRTYDGRELECKVLRLVNPRRIGFQPFPSRRYCNLFEEGARAHHLDSDYQAWIRSLPRYDGPQSFRQKIGKVIFLLIFAPPQVVLILLSQFWRPEQSPRFISTFLHLLSYPTWWCYTNVFRPIFGTGAGEIA